MVTKPYDLTDAVTYHIGGFPPSSLDYAALLGPLEEAAASLARYDTKMSGMVNSELFLAPLQCYSFNDESWQCVLWRPSEQQAPCHIQLPLAHQVHVGQKLR